MTKFSAWLNDQIKKIGGIEGLAKAMPEYSPQNIAVWSTGLRSPGWRAQAQISDLLHVQLSEVRSQLDLPYTQFSELIVRKVLAHGDFTNFCLKVGINKSRLDKWLAEGKLPNDSAQGYGSEDLRMIRDALILWGDKTPIKVLMAELVLSTERSIAAKKTLKLAISKPCNFAQIAP